MTLPTKCAGYDDNGKAFACPNPPGTPWTKHWCPECDEKRKAGISRNLAELASSLGVGEDNDAVA